MTTYHTGNPIGSKDPRDLYDNAENLDDAVNTRTAESWDDRFGVARKTWWGMEQDFQQFLINSGYENIGDYGPGLEITARNQIFLRDGELYRAGAALELPYVTTGDWGSEGALFVSVGDAALRQELAAGDGSSMVGYTSAGYGATARTVQAKLRESVSVKDFGAVGDGVTDDRAAFAAAYAAIPADGGEIVVPPGEFYFNFTGADVVGNPLVVCAITKNNVLISGSGPASHLIMGGITAAALNAGSNDPSAAGNDAATIFNWNGVTGGGAQNLRVTGTGGATAISVGKARAKAFSANNSRRLVFSGIVGADVPGNVINIRGNGATPETGSSYCEVSDCIAENCSENGINFMGGTYHCSIIGSQSHRNQYQGFESGTKGLVCVGNAFIGNKKNGVSQVGNYGLIANNYCEGNTFSGVHLQYNNATYAGSNNIVQGNICKDQTAPVSVGILADENTANNLILGNRLIGNNEGIKLVGIAGTSPVVGFVITDNYIADPEARGMANGIVVIHADSTVIRGNTILDASAHAIVGQAAGDACLIENNFVEGLISKGSMTNTTIRNNAGGGYTTEAHGTFTAEGTEITQAISHGLATAPTWAQATFSNTALGAAVISSMTATLLNIKVEGGGDIPAGTKIYWQARV